MSDPVDYGDTEFEDEFDDEFDDEFYAQAPLHARYFANRSESVTLSPPPHDLP